MRPVLLLLVFFLIVLPGLGGRAFAATDPAAAAGYPLKIMVVELTSTTFKNDAFNGAGHADVDDGQSVHGLDFTYTCDFKVERLPEGQFYPAKWIKQPTQLRLLAVQPAEKGKFTECVLEGAVHDEVYVSKADQLTLISQEEFKQWEAEDKFAKRELTDLSGYSVKLLVANEDAAFAPALFLGLPAGRFKGFGQGDIFESQSVHGVDFSFECMGEITAGRTYAAKWIEPESQLEVLVPLAGQTNRYYSCKVATNVQEHVYVRLGPGENRRESRPAAM